MAKPAWEFQYSVETGARPEFVWQYWTNAANWQDLEPGAEFELDGPFAPGTRGITKVQGQEPRHWFIQAVDPGRSWTQEMPLPEASFIVRMQFEGLVTGGTRITQRLWLEGERAESFLDGVRIFETTTPDGLKRIAAIIEEAQTRGGDSAG